MLRQSLAERENKTGIKEANEKANSEQNKGDGKHAGWMASFQPLALGRDENIRTPSRSMITKIGSLAKSEESPSTDE